MRKSVNRLVCPKTSFPSDLDGCETREFLGRGLFSVRGAVGGSYDRAEGCNG
jgi:hypothetical protein